MKIFRSSISPFFVLLFFGVLGFWIPRLSFAGRAGKMVTPPISHTATLLEDGRHAPRSDLAILDTAEI